MYRHSHLVFELLDIDGGHTVGLAEFKATRFLFNIKEEDLSRIFKDFDITGDEVKRVSKRGREKGQQAQG